MRTALVVCGLTLASLAHAATPPPLLPLPAQLQTGSGTFHVDAHTRIVVPAHDALAAQAANYLSSEIAASRGLHLAVSKGESGDNAIVFVHEANAPVAQKEGYALDVDQHGMRIEARDGYGLFHGAVTAWQLLTPQAGQDAVDVPGVHIRDWPRFAWRGLMLDSCRHFQSVAQVKALINQMAQLKFNVLHWHLSDDQGWRIEIKRYPELTRIGAWRTPPDAGENGEPQRYGGFYTQEQIRDVVAYAAARHITIVPELDMPGHAQAAVAAYPQLGVTGERPAVSTAWGVNPYLYNVDDATFTFIDNVLDEVLTLFPSKYIHVGGDEAIKDQWKASPAIQAKIHALGLKDEDALQGWFIGRVGQYLSAHGRRLVGWDEILDGGVPADATVMSWRGTDGAIKAAQAGHDVIMSPSPDLYLDNVQSDRDDESSGRTPVETLESVYQFQAVPSALSATQATHVLGVQANIWTEHLPDMRHVEHAAFPRAVALSEVDWTPQSQRSWPGFLARLPAQLARYRQADISYADSAFAVSITLDDNAALESGKAQVTLDDQANAGDIRYTTDGSEPTLQSPRYTQPFKVSVPTTLKATSFAGDGSVLGATRTRVIDRNNLLARVGTSLPNCPGSESRMRLQPSPDATSMAPVYAINVFDACQVWRHAPLQGITKVQLQLARLPNNFALAHDITQVISRKHRSAFGEVDIHQDSCDGPLLASLPLPDPGKSKPSFTLSGPLHADGTHGICVINTGADSSHLYGIGQIQLLP